MIIDVPQSRGQDRQAIECIATQAGIFFSEEIETVREMLEAFFNGPPDSDEFIWAVYRESAGTPPLGFVCYGPCSFSDNAYDLYWIAVNPSYYDRGIGTALVEYVESDLRKRNGRQLFVETSDKQNVVACSFYAKRGFERVAYFPDFYRINDGKVIYRKVLQ